MICFAVTLANGPVGMKCTPEALINGPERIHSQELLRKQPKLTRLRGEQITSESRASLDCVLRCGVSCFLNAVEGIRMTDLPREDVQSYPRPPVLEPVPQRITVRLGGAVIADSRRALRVLETHHAPTYCLPPEDVTATLIPASGRSFCEWKGTARYFDVVSGSTTARRGAWSYDEPTEQFQPIAGYLAFYPGLMEECRVGDYYVHPQPGGSMAVG